MIHFYFFISYTIVDCEGRGQYTFECNEWFSKDKKYGGIMERTLLAAEGSSVQTTVYVVEIQTADFKGSSTTSNIKLKIIGSKGESKLQTLESTIDQFSKGKLDQFSFRCDVDLGEIKKIFVKSDCSGVSPNWLPSSFSVKNERTGKIVKFSCGMWFSKTLDDKKSERELVPSDLPPREIVSYRVDVRTMDIRGSGMEISLS